MFRRLPWRRSGTSLAPLANAADKAPAADKSVPVFGADISIVALPVFVTDKSGHAGAG